MYTIHIIERERGKNPRILQKSMLTSEIFLRNYETALFEGSTSMLTGGCQILIISDREFYLPFWRIYQSTKWIGPPY